MNSESIKAPRGRPKTLDPEQMLSVAMQAYWDGGLEGVSLNEICRRAGVSKPGLYREFGNEDGLRKAALNLYFEKVLTPILELAESDLPFHDKLNKVIDYMIAERDPQGLPKGCLLLKMRDSASGVGAATRKQIDSFHKRMLTVFEDMVSRAKAKNEFSEAIATDFAAVYIDAQLSNAMALQARGEETEVIRSILELAFTSFE